MMPYTRFYLGRNWWSDKSTVVLTDIFLGNLFKLVLLYRQTCFIKILLLAEAVHDDVRKGKTDTSPSLGKMGSDRY